MANKRRSKNELKELDALVERLRDFIRRNYVTAAEVARQIRVNDSTVYSWLLGKARPTEPERITAFLDSFRERTDPASLLSAISIANTRTGAGFPSRAVALSVSGPRVRFVEAAAGFQGFVQIVRRGDRNGKPIMRRYAPGMGRG
jgi:hypothetical protein